jgi:hypothetical protein
VLLVRKVFRELQVLKDFKVIRVLKDFKELLDLKEFKDFKVVQVLQVQLDPKGLQVL